MDEGRRGRHGGGAPLAERRGQPVARRKWWRTAPSTVTSRPVRW
ncbi:hypothetical protein Ae168Ps1_1868c [Pseudonocardia sp. Ae168_Ps1]|nr:hypothetical protein Ae168Ps1_1868c [Pseudonocardia sp. Ae168_Ps1]